jgi:hypothetical protein
MPKEEAAATLEERVKSLKEELAIVKEAKTVGEACKALSDFAQQKDEPFTTTHTEPNQWHKGAKGGGGGGCTIL